MGAVIQGGSSWNHPLRFTTEIGMAIFDMPQFVVILAEEGYSMKPAEMEAAMIRNRPEKTGKSLEEWCAVLRDPGITEKRDMKKHRKENHSVGHFQTQTIVKHYLQD